MAAERQKTPFSVTIQADNWFHLGWLDAVLGSPMRTFDDPDKPVLDEDCEAYDDGFEMADDAGFDITDIVTRMRKLNQLSVS